MTKKQGLYQLLNEMRELDTIIELYQIGKKIKRYKDAPSEKYLQKKLQELKELIEEVQSAF